MISATLTLTFFLNLYNLLFTPQQATIVFAGDAMMHQGQIDAARKGGDVYDFGEYFLQFADDISSADYAVVNLETPLAGKPYSGYPCFCAPDSYADAIKEAGFDMCTTANNHTLDKRDRGLKRTIEVLNSRGLDHVGTYRNKAQRDSILPLIREINDIKVGFLSYTYGTNGIEIQGDAVVDIINKEQIKRDITLTRQAGAELVCVTIHWGDEYKLLPNSFQKNMADFLVAEGVELVIGSHPHVIQPIEIRKGADGRNQLVVYSLGNFISNMKTADTRGGLMVKTFLSRKSGGKAQVDSAAYKLVFTVPAAPGQHNYYLTNPDSCTSAQWRGHAKNFASRARDIFTKHNKGEVKEGF